MLSGSPTGPQETILSRPSQRLSGTNYSTFVSLSFQVFAGQVVINTNSLPLAPISPPYTRNYGRLLRVSVGRCWAALDASARLTLVPAAHFRALPPLAGAYPTDIASLPGRIELSERSNRPDSVRDERAAEDCAKQYSGGHPKCAYQTTRHGGGRPFAISMVHAQQPWHEHRRRRNGIITGTPTTLGAQSLPVTLTDSTGTSFSEALAFFVAAPFSVLTTSLPNGIVGQAYNQTLIAGGGQAPYVWAIPQGSASALPPGLSLSSAGTIAGSPTASGTFPSPFKSPMRASVSLRNRCRSR